MYSLQYLIGVQTSTSTISEDQRQAKNKKNLDVIVDFRERATNTDC